MRAQHVWPILAGGAVLWVSVLGVFPARGQDGAGGQEPADITGVYRCEGQGQQGTVAITKVGDTYHLQWNLGQETHTGVGIREGGQLASSWPGGVVVYKIQPGPPLTLVGKFAQRAGDGALQTEKLTFQKALEKLPAPRDWKAGDRALVLWSGGPHWYPATVTKSKDGRYHVQFDDGDDEWTTPQRMIPDDLKVGDRVLGNWQNGGVYYPGKITKRDGDKIHIQYDDGDEEDATVAVVRVMRPRME